MQLTSREQSSINRLLIFLIALDVVIAMIALFFPDFWCEIFHGTDYLETYGLLRRTAAIWVAFALFQAIALVKWKQNYLWLVIVAGLRLSEVFSDWAYLAFSDSVTWFAWAALLLSPPSNLFFGWYLFSKANLLKSSLKT
ncbi:MAG: hypothetical protein A2X86_09555 [Bdellovibrionales bacterium GWA2_49_15]|nr:MAG: hypothetical protein A2X86_09555 [Bdellovibrionales bacterium GWA2_49_15]HAZ13025.1 hypothetical protein [Bdellovibrionales bacterium]